jgi:hypothetical protein
MRERSELAGGWCRLHSLPGQGTTVEFWVPGRPPAAPEAANEDEDPRLLADASAGSGL